MRRDDRRVKDNEEIVNIIKKCTVCRLAFNDNEYPYIVPMSFGFSFDGANLTLYFHCAKEGKKLDLINRNNKVAFEIDRVIKIIVDDKPCASTMEYESVIGTGKAIILDDSKADEALSVIMRQYSDASLHRFEREALEQTTVFKVVVNSITAKRLRR
jgi:nitroimidazol reductase NimA-like FMN-containing flavoprotein (pyridoxamine 5'-phosphate oxidase superfamily)